MTDRTPGFIGLDIETTGLDPKTEEILELGIVIFDDQMMPIEGKSWLFDPTTPRRCTALADMADVVRQMHTDNGLIADLNTQDRGTASSQIHEEAQDFILSHTDQKLPMLGSSISFDRAWLDHFFPDLLNRIHYRSMDATSVRLHTMAMLPQEHREAAQEILNTELEVAKNHMHSALKLTNAQRHRPHRVLYDICASAALAHACHHTTLSINNLRTRSTHEDH